MTYEAASDGAAKGGAVTRMAMRTILLAGVAAVASPAAAQHGPQLGAPGAPLPTPGPMPGLPGERLRDCARCMKFPRVDSWSTGSTGRARNSWPR